MGALKPSLSPDCRVVISEPGVGLGISALNSSCSYVSSGGGPDMVSMTPDDPLPLQSIHHCYQGLANQLSLELRVSFSNARL